MPHGRYHCCIDMKFGKLIYILPYRAFSGGRIYQSWPQDLLEKYSLKVEESFGVFLENNSWKLDAIRSEIAERKLDAIEYDVPVADKKNYMDFKYFRISSSIKPIKMSLPNTPQVICENQFSCDFKPEGHKWGCARNLKKQTANIKIKNAKFPREDICSLDFEVLTSLFKDYVISKKFRDLLKFNNMTGFEIMNILSEDSAYADRFQMKITEIANPIPVDNIISKEDDICSVCNGYRGFPDIWTGFKFPISAFKEVDLQLVESFIIPEKGIIKTINPIAIASNEFINLVVKNKISGLIKRKWKNWYEPVDLDFSK